MKQQIVFTHKFEQSLLDSIAKCNPDKIFVLADDTTIRMCYNRIKHFECLKKAQPITIPSADVNKNLTSLSCVWTVLQSWWWNGNRYWGICRSYIQAWH